MMNRFYFYSLLLLPLLFLLLFAPWSRQIDLAISNYFFDGDFNNFPFYQFVFDYAIYPAWLCILGALIGFILSFRSSFYSWRKPTFYLIATLALGSGIIIHFALKDHWGRPRPKQVVEFNGNQEFIPFYQANFNNQIPSKSFPCGHCSMGFYFFSIALLGLYYNRKAIFYLGLFLTFFLGILLSYVRIAQGGHFFSDVLVSGIIMWMTSLILFFVLFDPPPKIKKKNL